MSIFFLNNLRIRSEIYTREVLMERLGLAVWELDKLDREARAFPDQEMEAPERYEAHNEDCGYFNNVIFLITKVLREREEE